jgi:hypothetical protein
VSQRAVTLNASAAGMTRLRNKGGASPQTLYDLSNGYVNASRCPQQRPGTTWLFNFADSGHTANAGLTRGLACFRGVLYTFCHTPLSSGSSTFKILTLRHPTDNSATLEAVHFAQPFMGYLYVVAEFSDGLVKHYWLQSPPAWKAVTIYQANQLVQPSADNGYYYKAHQVLNPVSWGSGVIYKLNDLVQPTTYNGFGYAVTAETGPAAPPAPSGATEPVWPLQEFQVVYDYSTTTPPPTPGQPPAQPPTPSPGTGPGGRYDNRGGSVK